MALDITSNEKLILKMLEEYYPELDVGPGTPLYEQIVRPPALLWAKHSEGMAEFESANTFPEEDSLNDMATEDVDRLMRKFFEKRKQGVTVTGRICVVFNSKNRYNIFAGTLFLGSSDKSYVTTTDTIILATDLTGDDTAGYPVTLQVSSTGVGNTFNAKANEIVKPPTELASYINKAYFVDDTSDGGIVEDNKAFYNRVKDSMTLKNLNTYRGVRGTLKPVFDIKDVVTVGLRDPEMRRDLIDIPTESGILTVHRGGHADIYVRNDPYTVVSGYVRPLGFPYSYGGISVVDRADELLVAWNSRNFLDIDVNVRGSVNEEIPLSIATTMQTLTSSIRSIQNYVTDMDAESITTNNLVKQMWPIVCIVDIRIIDPLANELVTSLKTVVSNYISALPVGTAPQIDNVINVAKTINVKLVESNVSLRAYYLKEDLVMEMIGTGLQRNPATSLLKPSHKDTLAFTVEAPTQISIRNCFFYTNKDLINIEVV